jgi:hypothetical protein
MGKIPPPPKPPNDRILKEGEIPKSPSKFVYDDIHGTIYTREKAILDRDNPIIAELRDLADKFAEYDDKESYINMHNLINKLLLLTDGSL